MKLFDITDSFTSDAVIKNNTMYTSSDGVSFAINFSDDIPDGLLFYSRDKLNWSEASLKEHLDRFIVRNDIPYEIKNPFFNKISRINFDIIGLNKYMADRSILRYDQFMTNKKGYLYLFHPTGLIRIKTNSDTPFKIKSSLFLNLTGYVDIIQSEKETGIEIMKSIYVARIYHKKSVEASVYADKIIPLIGGDFKLLENENEINGKPVKQFVNEKNTIREMFGPIESYMVSILDHDYTSDK